MQSPTRPVLAGFVVLEGIDGTGTTTQLHRLEKRLLAESVPHWTSFEPSELPSGKLVRRVLSGEVPAEPGTLARLFAADRNEHLYGTGGAIERLNRGEIVVFDRYLFSSLAYQGMACGKELPAKLNADFPLPELLIYFDVEVEIAMSRVARRPGRDIFEVHELQERVRRGYEDILSEFSGTAMRIVRVNAAAPLESVSALVDEAVDGVITGSHHR